MIMLNVLFKLLKIRMAYMWCICNVTHALKFTKTRMSCDHVKRKGKRSDSGLWQTHNTNRTFQKTKWQHTKKNTNNTSITQRLRADLGRPAGSELKVEGDPTNNQNGRGSGPCSLWWSLDKFVCLRHIESPTHYTLETILHNILTNGQCMI